MLDAMWCNQLQSLSWTGFEGSVHFTADASDWYGVAVKVMMATPPLSWQRREVVEHRFAKLVAATALERRSMSDISFNNCTYCSWWLQANYRRKVLCQTILTRLTASGQNSAQFWNASARNRATTYRVFLYPWNGRVISWCLIFPPVFTFVSRDVQCWRHVPHA